ncbi:MAG: tRNA (adenosine(37)-N6)-dimethylallyltransferase MiaA [Betaproteobacteria bacterium]|nr:tRNA (adenosine(37)-N6)-dimethylallyltransferase MiaA [Betaproteobacteria bacterium]
MAVPPAILVLGPTASGKSALAVHLAERFDGEIVSVDSAQVYRGMDIGTAKPGAAERARVPHHLLDILDPTERYSAALFVRDAATMAADIRARGRIPIFAGGTMLYFKAITEGLSALPHAEPAIRDELAFRAARDGWPAMHAELALLDPVAAARIKPHDAQRVQRALEVHAVTGRPLSTLQGLRRTPCATLARALAVALLPSDRARLHAAIAQRFDTMLEAGLVDELRALRQRYDLAPALPSMRSVGYRQAWEFLDERIDLAALRMRGIAATRQLAKRQVTWLRAFSGAAFDSLDRNVTANVERFVGERLADARAARSIL